MPSDEDTHRNRSKSTTVRFKWNRKIRWAVEGLRAREFQEGEVCDLPAKDAVEAADCGYGLEIDDSEEEVEIKNDLGKKRK